MVTTSSLSGDRVLVVTIFPNLAKALIIPSQEETYPLILSDDVEQTVYHAACAIEVATEIPVDVSTFFNPPAPQERLFAL